MAERARRGVLVGVTSVVSAVSRLVSFAGSMGARAVTSNSATRLRRLDLSGNFLSTAGLITLAQIVATNRTLVALYLDHLQVCLVFSAPIAFDKRLVRSCSLPTRAAVMVCSTH